MYNNIRTNAGQYYPLIIGFVKPTAIITDDGVSGVIYDPISQINHMDMRIVGTYSLKSRATVVNCQCRSDMKNEIDDQKQVF